MKKNSSLMLVAAAIASFAFFGFGSAPVASEVTPAANECDARHGSDIPELTACGTPAKGLFATVMDIQSRDHYDEPGRF